ncbi:MAG: hypothetical protein RLZZ450_666 [Pseudomonadota bacterium]|jgi:hypothetical protein
MSKLQLLAIVVVVFFGQALGARAQENRAPAAAPTPGAASLPAPAPTPTLPAAQAPAPPVVQAPAQYPAQAPAQYPAQQPAQYPAQQPAQYPAQQPAQYPAQQPAQYPAQQQQQYPAQQYPAQAPAQYPGQAPAANGAPGYPQTAGAPNPSLESPYGRQPLVQYPVPAPLVQSRELPRGYRTHDGFYLRMQVGAGVGGTTYKDSLGLRDDGTHARSRTVGGAFITDLAIGGAVVENLILHANLHFSHLDEIRKVGSRKWSNDDEELSTLLAFVGGGVTYYFMPFNLYVTGNFGIGGLSQTSGVDHDSHESGTGFGTAAAIGKEWWLGRSGQWAIGVALTGSYYQAPLEIDGIKSTYRGHSSGVVFSTTYN